MVTNRVENDVKIKREPQMLFVPASPAGGHQLLQDVERLIRSPCHSERTRIPDAPPVTWQPICPQFVSINNGVAQLLRRSAIA